MDDPRPVATGLLRTLPRHRDIAFAYGQGSAFAGFAAPDDIDVVVVWRTAPARLPQAVERFKGADFALDKVGTPKADVMHFELGTFTSWCELVEHGEGWRDESWPLPLHVVAGFAHGVHLTGSDDGLRGRMRTPSPQFTATVVDSLRAGLDSYLDELTRCAERDDHWLFGRIADKLVRHCYFAWFAQEGHYCPFPKHLHAWIDHLALSPQTARLEAAIWTGPLTHRTKALTTFAHHLTATP